MKITKWNVIGAIVALMLGGLVALLIFILGYIAFWYYMAKRGLLFVQSYVYLQSLQEHNDILRANWHANNLTLASAPAYAALALEFAQYHNGGEQLPVIKEARDRGYLCRGVSFAELYRWVLPE